MTQIELFNISDDELENMIDDTDFNLYGAFKNERKKLNELFKDLDVEYKLTTSKNTGNRVLDVRIFNPNIYNEQDICRTFNYTY